MNAQWLVTEGVASGVS